MQLYKMRLVDAGIALCGGQAGMAEQFLNGSKVLAGFQEMAGKRVS